LARKKKITNSFKKNNLVQQHRLKRRKEKAGQLFSDKVILKKNRKMHRVTELK